MKYLIGIDLGTTNCTMAYADFKTPSEVHSFPIAQITTAGMEEQLYSLPSFLYLPLEEEKKTKKLAVSWCPEREFTVGHFAKERGKELSGRVISSAKSWLCQTEVDRRSKLLPLEFEEESKRLSPVTVCSHFLEHLKEVWEQKMEGVPFNEQKVFVTVPASFDPAAKLLVQEAAEMAGFPEIVLLEEPQAAFYAWLQKNESTWRSHLKVGDTILVVDLGGGTSDFSLISVQEEEGNLSLKRVAVGAHLLLGGDNMDLTLAYFIKSQFEEEGKTVDENKLPALIHACRQAKETLLAENAPEEMEITLAGRGSKLIGGAIKTTLKKEAVLSLLRDGFFPIVSSEERSLAQRKIGMQTLGLPFAKDPRVTCQLAKFLSLMGEAEGERETFFTPTAVLFNGGVFKSEVLKSQVLTQLNHWAKTLERPCVKELPGQDLDLAVSQGAVYYGLARQGKGIRIRSGTSRSYYIGIEKAAPAVPGFSPPLSAVCIAPFGMEEGTEVVLDNKEFSLVVGEPASFRFFSHAAPELPTGKEVVVGEEIKEWKNFLVELHPIETTLESLQEDGKLVRVKLQAKVTELGFLELWCHAQDERKWKLEFNVRKKD